MTEIERSSEQIDDSGPYMVNYKSEKNTSSSKYLVSNYPRNKSLALALIGVIYIAQRVPCN